MTIRATRKTSTYIVPIVALVLAGFLDKDDFSFGDLSTMVLAIAICLGAFFAYSKNKITVDRCAKRFAFHGLRGSVEYKFSEVKEIEILRVGLSSPHSYYIQINDSTMERYRINIYNYEAIIKLVFQLLEENGEISMTYETIDILRVKPRDW